MDERPSSEASLRVLTLNLWSHGGDWRARMAVVREAIAAAGPEIVAFQEVVATGAEDQAVDVLGPAFTVVHSARRGPDGVVGASLASRLPILATEEVDLRLTDRVGTFPATAIVATVRHPAFGPIVFVNHLPSYQLAFERERELQAVAVARRVEELTGPPGDPPSSHAIVAGDFDAEPDAASVRFWTGRQSLDGLSVCYRNAWESANPGEAPALTYTTESPLLRDWDWPFRSIDHILVRCAAHGGPSLAVRSCSRFLDEPVDGVWASDHFGLLAELAAPRLRP